MREDEILGGVHLYVDVLLSDVVFVVLDVGDSGCILLLDIAYEAFQSEVVFI